MTFWLVRSPLLSSSPSSLLVVVVVVVVVAVLLLLPAEFPFSSSFVLVRQGRRERHQRRLLHSDNAERFGSPRPTTQRPRRPDEGKEEKEENLDGGAAVRCDDSADNQSARRRFGYDGAYYLFSLDYSDADAAAAAASATFGGGATAGSSKSISSSPNKFSKTVASVWRWKDAALGDGRDFFVPKPKTLRALQGVLLREMNNNSNTDDSNNGRHNCCRATECVVLSNCARFEIMVVVAAAETAGKITTATTTTTEEEENNGNGATAGEDSQAMTSITIGGNG